MFAFGRTCAQREGVVPHFAEVAVDAVQTELPLVTVDTAALPVSSARTVAVAHSISVTRSVGAPHAGFGGENRKESATSHLFIGFLAIGQILTNRTNATVAVRPKCSLWTAHLDGFNTEPLVQVGMFRFPAMHQETKQRCRLGHFT